MAFNLRDRFPPPPESFKLLDPGAYQSDESRKIKDSKAPFLSKCPRNTQPGAKIWTHAIYHADFPPKIPNCTSITSKQPRFPYEAFTKEDLDKLLCRCGIQNDCECSSEEIEPEFVCQGKVRKRLFIGHAPRASSGNGVSVPSKTDQGFEVLSDGSQKRLSRKVTDESPPFYDIRVDEFSAFYHGCKWSRWTSKRANKEQEKSPGPADYSLDRKPTHAEVCAEKVRAHKRKTSKQLRFIEMVQQRDILAGFPGPATYSPTIPTVSDLNFLGPKAKRFIESTGQSPGPADHCIRRDFDLPIPPIYPCHAKLPEPAFFGIKAARFKQLKEEGPSPATYSPNDKTCFIMHCPTAPFGSSSIRFKQDSIEDEDEELVGDNENIKDTSKKPRECPLPMWQFRSKTIRMKPLEKNFKEKSLADPPQSKNKVQRLRQLQYTAPFFSSEGRFQPWNGYIPVFGKYETPGPCYYELDKPKCIPAVCHGPLIRTPRFPLKSNATPGPNEYNIGGGIETVLTTHNQRLKSNIENQHKFVWEPPVETKKLSFEEQESALLNRSIALLDADIFDKKAKKGTKKNLKNDDENVKSKMLRCFLFSHPTPNV